MDRTWHFCNPATGAVSICFTESNYAQSMSMLRGFLVSIAYTYLEQLPNSNQSRFQAALIIIKQMMEKVRLFHIV